MKKISLLIIIGFAILLLGCTKKVIIVDNDNKASKLSCEQKLIVCKRSCVNDCRNCSQKSLIETSKSYSKYIREENIKGGMVVRRLNSYRDPLQCRKVSCDCVADYNVCIQARSGYIRKQWQISYAPENNTHFCIAEG